MPAQVVVVKRSRRRAFGWVRGVPSWFRAIWTVTRRSRGVANGQSGPWDDAIRPTCLGIGPTRPRLLRDAAGAHACVACGRCVAICPSRCLALAAESDAQRPARLDLIDSACIGCALCVDVCPEGALEMVPRAANERAVVGAGTEVTDLLRAGG